MTKQEERQSEIRRNTQAGGKRNNCSGTVNRGRDKKYPRINPRREVVPLGTYSSAYAGFHADRKVSHVSRRRCLNIQMKASPAAAIRGILPVCENPLSIRLRASPARLWPRVFHTGNFRKLPFPGRGVFHGGSSCANRR